MQMQHLMCRNDENEKEKVNIEKVDANNDKEEEKKEIAVEKQKKKAQQRYITQKYQKMKDA